MRRETPYAYDFLWKQIELGYSNIRKPSYRKLLKQFLYDEGIRNKLEKKEEKRVRKYKGGLLEKTASLIGLSLCIYDNYPEIDIDLLLTAIILNCISNVYSKSEFYKLINEYGEIVPFLFRKKRRKPTLEVLLFDRLVKLDDFIIEKLEKRRDKNENRKN